MAKVSDFGLAKLLRRDESDEYLANENTRFPIRWTAPEAIYLKRFSSKSDIWSLGVLIWEMVTLGKSPYPGLTNKTVAERIQKGYRMPNPAEDESLAPWCPANLYGLMLNCWHTKLELRPDFAIAKEIVEGILEKWKTNQAGGRGAERAGRGKQAECYESPSENVYINVKFESNTGPSTARLGKTGRNP